MLSAGLLAVLSVLQAARTDPGGAYVAQYQYTEEPATRLLTFGDGQFFGMLAEDPTLARPEALLVEDDGQFAYRAMRPAFGWAATVLSVGQSDVVPWALITLTVSSLGLLFVGAERLTEALGRDPRVAVAVIALPGVIRLLSWTGPEIAASGCACLAVAAAVRGRSCSATAWLVGAVLLRETLLLVAIGLVLSPLRRFRFVLVPGLAFAAWVVVIRLRVGAFPAGGARFEIGGLVEAASSWDPITVLAVVALFAMVLVGARRSPLALALAAPHLVLMAAMSPVTGALDDFGRIMLPMYALLLPFISPLSAHRSCDEMNRTRDVSWQSLSVHGPLSR